MVYWVLGWLEKLLIRRDRLVVIPRADIPEQRAESGVPDREWLRFSRRWMERYGMRPNRYIRRFYLYRSRGFGAYLHNILLPDPDNYHTHPGGFFAMTLAGGYWEEDVTGTRTWRGPWSPRWRSATDPHRIVGVEPGTWTLFVHFSWKRQWGFLDSKFDPAP